MILVRSHFAQAILDFACSLVLGRQHASTCCVMPDDPKPKTCKWCFRDETEYQRFPIRSAACGPCKATWEQIWRTVTKSYTKGGYEWLRREDNDVQESLYWEFKIWTIDMHRSAHLFEWETYIDDEFLRTPRPPPVPYIRLRSVAAGVGTVNAITDVVDLVDRAEMDDADAGTGGSIGSGSNNSTIISTGCSSSSDASNSGCSMGSTVNDKGSTSAVKADLGDLDMHEDPLKEELFAATPPLEAKKTLVLWLPSPVTADDAAVGGSGRRVRPRLK